MPWTDQLCIDALRAAAADLGAERLRQVDYRAWRRTHPDQPAVETVVWQVGSWAAALLAAGAPGARPRPGRRRAGPP